jgi:hypothetical protein
MRENILFTSAGDNTSFYNLWCSENRNYDIFTCYYGDSKTDKYKDYSDFYLKRKGSKIQNFHHVWNANIGNIQSYKRFYIVDDDIIISTNEINELFRLLEELNVWILQPSFSTTSKISHDITRQVEGNKYRFTNFVEINTPFFSNYAIAKCMKSHDVRLIYGEDALFIHTLGVEEENKYVIVDYISCINPERKEREINRLPYEQGRMNWRKFQKRFKLEKIIHKNFKFIK